jgi:hypothetical protein
MAVVDAGVGDEQALRTKSKADALGDPGEPRCQRRPDGAIENPDGTKAAAFEELRQPQHD